MDGSAAEIQRTSDDPARVQPDWQVFDTVWAGICREAERESDRDPLARRLLATRILAHTSFARALAGILATRLSCEELEVDALTELVQGVLEGPAGQSARADLRAIRERDPVVHSDLLPFLSFKGFHALQAYRVTHWLWTQSRRALAVYLQNRVSVVFGVDIHPAARLGSGLMMDHATGIVIGETSVVEDNVSLLHEVTLGGTGKGSGDRHPKVRAGVLLGAGAKLLGNIEIGVGAKVGAGSVVLDSVPPHCTVAGVPARIVARSARTIPAFDMDQHFPHSFEAGGGI